MTTLKNYRVEIILALAFGLSLLLSGLAFAQEAVNDESVQLPWGQVVASFVVSLGSVAGAIVYFAKTYLPAPARWAIELTKLDQLAEKAIAAATFDIAEDLRGKTISLEIKNKILRDAIIYAKDNAIEVVNRWGPTFESKLKARIQEYLQDKLGAN